MKSKITTFVFAIVLFVTSAICIVKPADRFSISERRPLAQMPEVNLQSVASSTFMTDFEKYATDQFPARDTLRSLKAVFAIKVLMKKDNNSLFVKDGHISKIDSYESEYMTDYASQLFEKIVLEHAAGKVYFSVIPDKNFILAKDNFYNRTDYDGFIERMKEKTPFMEYVDIVEYLSIDDYYTTDTHWRQEKIIDVAKHIANKMGTDIPSDYWENKVEAPFYGVYHGQLALGFEPDTMVYLTNDTIDNFTVTYYGSGKGVRGEVYDKGKLEGKDMYEMFLAGAQPLITIENPGFEEDKELVVFRDSYASSLAPLLAQGYKKTTLVDIRYIQSAFLKDYVDFNKCDVLFIYSTSVLNTSNSMK
ncbi:MAG: hypothetical protein IJ297_00395 [Clostridia bacterium]|nr:hypothetical protein [Clostridia bacterium]